jgi:hypothetical protein
MMPYIYKKTIIHTGKYYIGKHNGKLKSYIGSGTDYLEDVKIYVKDRKKDIIHEILEYVDDISTLNERETYWLEFYNAANDSNSYNRSNISHGCHITKESTKRLQSESSPFRRKIIQYSLDGKFIKIWEWMGEVTQSLSIPVGELTTTCQGKQKSAGGFQWRYHNNGYPLNIEPYLPYSPTQDHKNKISKKLMGVKRDFSQFESILKPILQYDKTGNFIKEYKYIREACRELNIGEGTIHGCLSGRNGQKTAGGFRWKYKLEDDFPTFIGL